MFRLQHSERRHRIVGLFFFVGLIAILMVAFLDGAGYRAWRKSQPELAAPIEVIKLRKKVPESRPPPPAAKRNTERPASAPSTPAKPPGASSQPKRAPSAPDSGGATSKPAGGKSAASGTAAPPAGAPPKTKAADAAPAAGAGQRKEAKKPVSAPVESRNNGAPGQWHVQAGSYLEEKNASEMRKKLALSFKKVYIESAEINQKRHFRVKIGPLKDNAAAIDVQRRLRGFGIINAQIESSGPLSGKKP